MYSRDYQRLVDRFSLLLPMRIELSDGSMLEGYMTEIDLSDATFNFLGPGEDEFYTGVSVKDVIGIENIDYDLEPGKSIVLYVDDVRKGHPEKANEIVVKSVKEAIYVIELAQKTGTDIELLDLDHDLGAYEPFGGDAINLVYYLVENKLFYPVEVHSSNPAGKANIMQVVDRNWRGKQSFEKRR